MTSRTSRHAAPPPPTSRCTQRRLNAQIPAATQLEIWQRRARDDYSVYILVVHCGFVTVGGTGAGWRVHGSGAPPCPLPLPPQGNTLQVSAEANVAALPHLRSCLFLFVASREPRKFSGCSKRPVPLLDLRNRLSRLYEPPNALNNIVYEDCMATPIRGG